MKDLFKSKKFRVLIGCMVSILLGKLGVPGLADMIQEVLIGSSSYIVGQGLADFGKEAGHKKLS